MKLATLRDGSRDGRLLVVSRDLKRAVSATRIADNLQTALDNWAELAPRLAELAAELASDNRADAFDLDVGKLAAPLPRAFGFIDSSVYLNHMELARKLRGATVPEAYRREPLLSIRLAGPFLGATENLPLPPGDVGMDIEAEVAAILDDVPMGATVEQAAASIRLLTVVSDTSLRTVFAREVAEGKTTYHGKAPPLMAPVVATPDECGTAWDGAKLSLPVVCTINGKPLGQPNAGTDMSFTFPEIIAHASTYRPLPAGTILAAGTVSNRDRAAGSACIAERRMVETLDGGKAVTGYLQKGDSFRIEVTGPGGGSLFGAIEPRVV